MYDTIITEAILIFYKKNVLSLKCDKKLTGINQITYVLLKATYIVTVNLRNTDIIIEYSVQKSQFCSCYLNLSVSFTFFKFCFVFQFYFVTSVCFLNIFRYPVDFFPLYFRICQSIFFSVYFLFKQCIT